MLALLALALVSGGWCANEYYVSRQLDINAAVTSGVVTHLDQGRRANLHANYTAQGQAYSSRTSRYTDEQVGDEIEIVYDSRSPSRFQTGDFAELQGQYFGAQLLFGVAATATACALALAGYRSRRY